MGNVTVVGEDRFKAEVLESELPVFVDFFATWCGPCKAIAPTLEQLAADFQGKMRFVKVDIDESPNVTDEYAVQGVPTLVIFDRGSESARFVGAYPRDTLLQAIRCVLGE